MGALRTLFAGHSRWSLEARVFAICWTRYHVASNIINIHGGFYASIPVVCGIAYGASGRIYRWEGADVRGQSGQSGRFWTVRTGRAADDSPEVVVVSWFSNRRHTTLPALIASEQAPRNDR